MSQDPLRNAIETIRTQIQAELDTQLAAVERQHGEALELARKQAADEAEARWTAELARVNADWESRLKTALAEAAAEAERRTAAEIAKAQIDAEQKADDTVAQAKREAAQAFEQTRAELEQALHAERSGRASADDAHAAKLADLEREIENAHRRADALDAELAALRTQHAQTETAARQQIEEERRSLESRLSAAREHETESRAAERQSRLAATERLLSAVQAISEARSLSDVLTALSGGAAAEASRAAVLVPTEGGLQPFRAAGFDPDQIRHRPADTKDDVLGSAMRDGKAVSVTPQAAPAFAALVEDRAGIAVPITVGGQAVAVLYADNGRAGSPEVPASWPEAVQILCHHASAAVSHLTAVRTTQAMRLMRPPAAKGASRSAHAETDADQAARRYARLLVSEIKLYNESAVRIGREKRDLLTRLRPEIERARRLYEERVSHTVTNRAQYFEHELRQTLADGDASLLGQQAVFP